MSTPPVAPGERFGTRARWSAAEIAAFATAAGDTNPLHHDPVRAGASRFGGIIASGTQATAMLMALTASHFSRPAADGRARGVLGLDFSVELKAAVHADRELDLWWEVRDVEPKASLGGWIVRLHGAARFVDDGRDAVRMRGTVLVTLQD